MDNRHAMIQPLFYVTFPEAQNQPAQRLEFVVYLRVALHVALDLVDPKLFVVLKVVSSTLPILTMPELAITENRNFCPRQNDVRFAWQFGLVYSVTVTSRPKGFSQG